MNSKSTQQLRTGIEEFSTYMKLQREFRELKCNY